MRTEPDRRGDSLILALALMLFCASAQAVDLLEVYRMALNNDPLFKQAAANKRAVLEERPQAIASLLPSIGLSASIAGSSSTSTGARSRTIGEEGQIVSVEESNADTEGYTLSLSQPVFDRASYYRIDQADSSIKQADAELAAAENDLTLRVASAYFNVLAAMDNLRFAEAEKRSLGRQLEQARQRFDVGLTAVTDVQEAQAGYDRAVAEEIRAINGIDVAREALREITGDYLMEFEELTEAMPLVRPDPASIEAWSEMAIRENLNVIAAIHAVDVARDEIKVQSSGHYPTVDLTARRSYDKSDRTGVSEDTNNSIGLQLNFPIYAGGAVNSRTRQTRELLDLQLARLEQVRRQAHRDARESYLGVISGISQIDALEQAVVSSQVALEATRAGFEVGTRTAVDVIIAERALFQARRDLARARYDYILSTLNLKQAAGRLTVDDVGEINDWLE